MLTLHRRRLLTLSGAGLATLAVPSVLRAAPRVLDASIASFAFEPENIEISQGDRVVWTNDDLVPHTATAVSGAWDTGPLRKGEVAEIEFSTAGEFEFFCRFHPTMRGVVVVT
jgi:plastocyanin